MSWRRFFRRDRWDKERTHEIEAHLEIETDENIARGMSPEEARYAAQRKLGNPSRIREEIYRMNTIGFVETLGQDLRYTLRTLWKSPGFTIVTILTLALGIGANTAIFSVVNGVLLQPFPFPKQGRLMMLWEKEKDQSRSNTSFATFTDWNKENRSFTGMAVLGLWSPTLVTENDAENLNGFRVSSAFFDILGVKLELGRGFLQSEDVRGNNFAVILSYSLWVRRFHGDRGIVGKPIALGARLYTVVGVLPANFPSVFSFDPQQATDIYAPLAYDATLPYACRTCRHLRAIAGLKDGVSQDQAAAEMNQISQNLFREYPSDYPAAGVALTPLRDYVVGDVQPVLYTLLGSVGFVLLIACVNVASLMRGWAVRKQREMAVRAALGARRMRLVRQFLTESILLSLLGGTLGFALAVLGVELLRKMGLGNLPRLQNVQMDAWVFLFTLGVSLLTGLGCGVVPAWRASKLDLNEGLKEGAKSTPGKERRRTRGLLVVSDVALALVLLTGAGLMMKSFARLLEVKPGFDTSKTLTMNVSLWGQKYSDNAHVAAFYQQVLDRVEALPGVESAGVVSQLPLGGNLDMYGMHIVDKPNPNPADDPSADRYSASPHYLHAMHIPLLNGRNFTQQDRADSPPVAIINQTFAERIWSGENPIGKRIRMGDPTSSPKTVVRVVGDVLHRGLDAPHTLQIYLPHAQMADSAIVLVVRTSTDPIAFSSAIRREIAAVDPLQPVSGIATLENVVATSVTQQRFSVLLFVLFAAIALILAAVGIYGVIAYAVAQRTHEIGIRMTLGAGKSDILTLVVGEGMKPAMVGTALGMIAAFGLMRLLTSFLYDVEPTDPATFSLVSSLLAVVALLACYIPARHAIAVDPLVALHHE
jgi:putative ABC transport system permease protein